MICPDCNGAGVLSETHFDEFPDWCETCRGEGHVDNYKSHGSTLTNVQIDGLRDILGEALSKMTNTNVRKEDE